MRSIFLTFALLALCLLSSTTQAQPQKRNQPVPVPAGSTAREMIDQANAALKAGDETRAVKIFDAARSQRDFASARSTLALIFAAGDAHAAYGTKEGFDEALAIYATINESPLANTIDRGVARVKRAEAFLRQDKATLAKEEINAIRASGSRRGLLMADLGDASIQLHLGQAEAARDRLLPLIESDEPALQSMAMFSLGRAYVQLKQPEQAVAIFRKLWNKYGETPYVKNAVFLVGGIYLDRGDFMEARKLFEACSVIGASMQSRVQPGQELVIKVSDPNYFARTRSLTMPVIVTVPSGDNEIVKLDKNPVSDVLYTGRIQTALAAPAPKDGTLQVRGTDEISMTYDGQVAPPRKVLVVDDGRINIDSVPVADPPPRGTRPLASAEAKSSARKSKAADEPDVIKPILPTGRQTAGSLNPGSPVYVQVIDADLDKSDQPDTMIAHVVAHGARGDTATVQVTLTETGPTTGIFTGTVPTVQATASISASTEAVGHPASAAVDVDSASPSPGQKIEPAKANIRQTYWKAKPADRNADRNAADKSHWLEIDLRQPAFLGKMIWGPGTDPLAEKCSPTSMTITIRGDNVEKIIPISGKPKLLDNEIDLGGVFARTIRIDFNKWEGDSPAIGQIIITDATAAQLVPTGVDAEESEKKGVLEFDVGQTVSARYTDDENENPGIPVIRESRRLGASYHNASIDLATKAGESKSAGFSAAWRLDLASEPYVVVSDADLDTTINPDKLSLEVFTESGAKRKLELTETGPATGLFAAALPITDNAAAKNDARLLYVRPGDLVWMTYLDERNLQPGYRTFRNHWVLENRPTPGEIAPIALLQTAWPFQSATAEGSSESPIVPRSASDGRVNISISDPDALSRSGQSIAVKTSALLSGTSQELTLSAGASGSASRALDLVLGDKDVDRALEGNKGAAELTVAGDDLIRIAYTDAKVPTHDLQTRAIYTEEQLKSQEKTGPAGKRLAARAEADPAAPEAAPLAAPVAPPAPGVAPAADDPAAPAPLIRLRDPQRRLQADQDSRLKEFKQEMNYRLAAYAEETKALTTRRDLLKSRLIAPSAKPGPQEQDVNQIAADDALKATIAALNAQIETLNQRTQRLAAMGATADRARLDAKPAPNDATAAGPSEMDKIKQVQDGPLTPGQPFDISIDDADLTAPEIDVRIRSIAGRLVQAMSLKAARDATGQYKVRIPTARGESADAKILSLMPGGEVIVDYADAVQKDPGAVDRVTYLALASDAHLDALNPNYTDAINEIRLGEAVHIQVTDFDQDRSPAQDRIIVNVSSTAVNGGGDTLAVICTETEPHSGVFRGLFITDRAKPNPNDDVLQADYGGAVILSYADYLRASPGSEPIKTIRLKISGGADGTVEGFSRQFRSAKDEMQLWYRTGQAAYNLGRKLYLNHSIERAEENFAEATDYFTQLVSHFPEDPLAASSNYYLGNIQALKGNNRLALARFQEVVTRWPKSEFVARSRFKIGQSFESLGQFDQAADAYVLLTYHHPDDPNVPTAMIRMMNYYARSEDWADAVTIAQKFVDKFPDHPQAGSVALKAGQWLAVAEKVNEALSWFVRAEKVFAAKDKEMPSLLYWHAATLISSNKGQLKGNAPRAEKVKELLNRVVYDYPANEFVPLAKIALEQMAEKK